MSQNPRNARKARIGTVVSDKMDRTVIVQVERRVKHPFYGKQITRRARFAAHDADESARAGDKVRIEETRPLSKTKRWRVAQVLERAE